MRDEYELTDSIQILIDYDYPVRIANVVEWDVNLTFVDDLIRCCVHQLKKLGETSLVGEGCSLAEGVELVDTVIGDNVTIPGPMPVSKLVVARLPSAGAVRPRMLWSLTVKLTVDWPGML